MAATAVLPARILLAVSAVGTAVFIVLAVLVRTRTGGVDTLDGRIAQHLHDYATQHRAQLGTWRALSSVFAPVVLRIASVLAGLWLWWRGQRSAAVLVVVAVLGTTLLSTLTKLLIDRDRPHFADPVAHATGQSYPSGHALTSFVAAAVVVLVCTGRTRRIAAALGAVVVVAVGLSRLVLGVHYLSDVLAGWALGAAWVCAVLLLVRRSGLAPRVRP